MLHNDTLPLAVFRSQAGRGVGNPEPGKDGERIMSAKVSIPGSRPVRWWSFLSHALAGAMIGALLAGGYGALVAGVRLASTGRWDRGPAFALGALLAGTVVGLAVGIALG